MTRPDYEASPEPRRAAWETKTDPVNTGPGALDDAARLRETIAVLERDRLVFREQHKHRRDALHRKIDAQVAIAREMLQRLLGATVKDLALNLHEPSSFHVTPDLLLLHDLTATGMEHPVIQALHAMVDSPQCPVVLDDMSDADYVDELGRRDREIAAARERLAVLAANQRSLVQTQPPVPEDRA